MSLFLIPPVLPQSNLERILTLQLHSVQDLCIFSSQPLKEKAAVPHTTMAQTESVPESKSRVSWSIASSHPKTDITKYPGTC